MPHSPFTRFFGLAIVAVFFLALLWPDKSAALWEWQALITLPIVIGIFSWSAVRGAPPFDDRAFHRTLPPGDGYAFRRVIMIHMMVLAGIAFSVIVYCRIYNFGWSAMAYGISILTIPLWTLMAACGVANSLSISRQHGLTWPYLAIFLVPAAVFSLICWLRGKLGVGGYYPYFTGLQTMAITGAVLYPVVWWLVAVKRRRALGLGLGIATGVLIPWTYVCKDFLTPSGDSADKSHVTISRNAAVPLEGKWLRVDEVLTVTGLREGEFVNLDGLGVNHTGFRTYEVPDDPAGAKTGYYYAQAVAGQFEVGTVSWGERSAWNYLRKQLPAHETFDFWNSRTNTPTHLSILREGKLMEPEFMSPVWTIWNSGIYAFEKIGEVDVETGGNCNVPGGGILRAEPLRQNGVNYSISFRRYYPDPWQTDGVPWFGMRDANDRWTAEPWIIAVDQSGQHAFALPGLDHNYGRDSEVMLGKFHDLTLHAGENVVEEEGLVRMEMLRHCRLHIFWPKRVAPLQREIPPLR